MMDHRSIIMMRSGLLRELSAESRVFFIRSLLHYLLHSTRDII